MKTRRAAPEPHTAAWHIEQAAAARQEAARLIRAAVSHERTAARLDPTYRPADGPRRGRRPGPQLPDRVRRMAADAQAAGLGVDYLDGPDDIRLAVCDQTGASMMCRWVRTVDGRWVCDRVSSSVEPMALYRWIRGSTLRR